MQHARRGDMFMTCIDTRTLRLLALALAAAGPLLTALPAWAQMPTGLHRLQHIVVIYLENRSFDNLYGLFPGATGIANAGAAALQVDHDGTPFAKLPPVIDTRLRPPAPDTRFPPDLPNGSTSRSRRGAVTGMCPSSRRSPRSY